MQNKLNTNIERIIAKIDNDFNPDGSDWIPRVGTWVYDAMSQLDVVQKETKRRRLKVTNGIAYSPCDIDIDNLKVYDSNGCIIKEMGEKSCQCSIPLRADNMVENDDYDERGDSSQELEFIEGIDEGKPYGYSRFEFTPDTIDKINQDGHRAPDVHAVLINDTCNPPRYNVIEIDRPGYNSNNQSKNYVVVGSNKIQVNFDTPYITIEHEEIKSEYSSVYGCELPVIPNNGLLIEAIAYYCMYKMLCRGYNHPVFNLKASQYGTNPYYEWGKLKDEAKRKSIIDAQGEVIDDSNLWQSAFYIYTFCR